MLSKLRRYAPVAISLFAAAVFLDSLRYKFTDHPKTQEIFGRLDGWATSLGAPGLFGHTGLFSQYVIGSAELAASTLLLVGLLPRLRRLNALGALIGLAVMTGAVSFHLFTPLGIDPNNDGGGLFAAAVTIWISAIVLLIIRRNELRGLAADLARAFIPGPLPGQADAVRAEPGSMVRSNSGSTDSRATMDPGSRATRVAGEQEI